jgi:hypothetical protein
VAPGRHRDPARSTRPVSRDAVNLAARIGVTAAARSPTQIDTAAGALPVLGEVDFGAVFNEDKWQATVT